MWIACESKTQMKPIKESGLGYKKIPHWTIADRLIWLISIQNKQNVAAWLLLDRDVLFNLNVLHSFGLPIINESKSKPLPNTLLNTGWVLPHSLLFTGEQNARQKIKRLFDCLSLRVVWSWDMLLFQSFVSSKPSIGQGKVYFSGTFTLWLHNTSFFLIPCHDVD